MFKNYFKTAFRSLSRNKSYTAINITGLAVGIAVCLVIFLILQYEMSFDNFHKNKAHIFRVMTKPEKGDITSAVPFPLPTAMKNDFPQLQTAAMYYLPGLQIMVTDKKFKSDILFTEPSFLNIFSFPLLAGNVSTVLQSPNSAVLTKKTAEKYFGDWKNAIGKSLKVDNNFLVTITGILEDVPTNTDFQLSILIPYDFLKFSKSKDWYTINSAHECYVMLPDKVSVASINQRLISFSKKYRTPDNKNTQLLQPLNKVHYDKIGGNYSGKTITPERIRTLWMIAAFILIIACVNFINLSTAQAVNRAKEVGVRKVLGGNRWQLKIQFQLETLLLVVTSVLFATLITTLMLKPVGKILNIPLAFDLFHNAAAILFLALTIIVVTILAGFYPSLVLAGFNPITALKSRFTSKNTKGISLRRGLVAFQFIIAQALIIGTLLLVKQMNYFENTPMGFNKDAIVNVPFQSDSVGISKLDYLRSTLLSDPNISLVSFNNAAPSDDDNWWTGFKFNHAAKETEFPSVNKWIDADYIKTYQLPLVAGRNITTTDSIKEFLITETVVKKLGYSDPHNVLNKEINLWNGFAKGNVVGVLKDFHSTSLKNEIAPVFMVNLKRAYNTATIKIASSNMSATMKRIEKIWSDIYPNYVFEYQFLDEKIASFYREEKQLSQLYKIFAGIAIFLSCLGLYGLASFMSVQRIKEVGVRKVLGATAANIVYLFSKEFMILIAIAFVIAAPLTWYFMHQWLQNFVYKTTISWWVFAIGGVMSVVVALVTVSFQAIKAAATNPAKSLRSE